jgi:NDP-sugar pyrophosphorylase family protein
MRAVILAGGEGTRLRPYTTVLPKPLMPVGNYPIVEIIVRQLRNGGVTSCTFAVGYLHQLIEAYFGDGKSFGVEIDYLREDKPLGTSGPLAALTDFDEPILVLNGDILTDIDYSELYRYHLDRSHDITIASHAKSVRVDLGVLDLDQRGYLVDYIEKPEYDFQVSMGVYIFSPSVLEFIPPDERLDFPDLVRTLLRAGRSVGCYRYDGLWLDIGRTDDYQVATETFEMYRDRFLPGEPARDCHSDIDVGEKVAGRRPA